MGSYEYRDNLGNPRDYYDIVNDATKMCDEIERQDEEIKQLKEKLNDIKDYVNFLIIFNQTINGKFNETQWGKDILGLIGD